ncbi:MAG: signal recognition particle protein [Mycoplasmataceae bacterium]|nr:signal recognition particle protein [Mycoplasmataceae bacterium]
MFKTLLSSIVAKHFKKKLDSWTIKEEDVTEVLKQIRIALLDADVNLLVVKEFIKNIRQKAVGRVINQGEDPEQVLLAIIKDELVDILGKHTETVDTNKKQIRIMMVGLQGSGKTTTAAKLANYFKTKFQRKPLLVALDIYRPAAIDQLETLAKEINADFFQKGTQNPIVIANQALEFAENNQNNVIIFDTAGRLQTNDELMEELKGIRNRVSPDEILLVVDAMSGQDVINVASEFNKNLDLTGFVITKLDSDARAGASLSLTHLLNVPVKFTGVGERIGSLDIFHPDRIADRILGLGDIVTLAEKATEVLDEDKAKKSLARMLAGKMDFEDLLEQMKQMSKLGSMSTITKMLPNAPKLTDDKLFEAEKKMKTWQILMTSMTLKERRNPGLFKKYPNRKIRVVKGSGCKPDDLNKMLAEWEKAKKKMFEIGSMIRNGRNPFSQFGIK